LEVPQGVLELEKQGLFDVADYRKSKGRCESTGPFYLLLHLYEDFGIFENSQNIPKFSEGHTDEFQRRCNTEKRK